ncbi:hypothetical protein [Jiella marina]|uniref:hypothetical protein n=1 Tax=Jiella sp. LLJ827 TaxID=2917712 RepID=UPI0021017D35|nr:hypothetical protein [Jiella sp. LLJ827]MCQ0986429.1 hypothetical protein [Jiella sp. LLJ827]
MLRSGGFDVAAARAARRRGDLKFRLSVLALVAACALGAWLAGYGVAVGFTRFPFLGG